MVKHFRFGISAQVMAACALVFAFSGCTKQESTAPAASTTVGNDVDDSVITTKIKAAFLLNDSIKSLDIKVVTMKGDVMLSGFVNSADQIETSMAVAKSIPGVKNITNQLSVKVGGTTVGAKIDDDVITTKVHTALINDSVIKSFDIAAVTRNGEVLLSGFVDNQAQITHAIDVAQSVSGVTSVQNHMTIKN
jgi:hyperosmotically inducible periplasmic protein